MAHQPSAGPTHANADADVSPHGISQRLYGDWSFWGMTITQFLGAFNDNLFKQLILLLSIKPGDAGSGGEDQQGLAMVIFSIPFVLGSGFAGFVADRCSKQRVVVVAKLAEIVAMLLGVAAFRNYATTGYTGLLIVLFLMGLHSTFFGPGKYGILPELFRRSDLPRANGVMLMTTFLAIILGTATAGGIRTALAAADLPPEQAAEKLWIGSLICVGIAVVGALTSLWVRYTKPAQPNLKLTDWTALIIPRETRQLLASDWPLLKALLASCVFWLVAGVAISGVNSLGKEQFGVNDLITSTMTATIGLGICIGAVAAGRLSQGGASPGLVRVGAWSIVVLCLLMALAPSRELLLRASETVGMGTTLAPVYVGLAAIGMAAALFAIPLQVFLQDRPPADQKGRMIAAMNLMNFIAIAISGVTYGLFDVIIREAGWPRAVVFAMMALLMAPVALFYRPDFDSAGKPSDSR